MTKQLTSNNKEQKPTIGIVKIHLASGYQMFPNQIKYSILVYNSEHWNLKYNGDYSVLLKRMTYYITQFQIMFCAMKAVLWN